MYDIVIGGPKFGAVLESVPSVFLAYLARFSPRLMKKRMNIM